MPLFGGERDFDLAPEGTLETPDLNLRSNGVMECWSNGKTEP